MKRLAWFLTIVALAGVSLTAAMASAAEQSAVPQIPGITVEDSHPNGCVDCHRKVSDTRDYSLQTEIKNLIAAGEHPKAPDRLLQDLNGCLTCHKADGKQPLGPILHKVHLVGGAENHFITNYQGQCTQCHGFNADEGTFTVKGL